METMSAPNGLGLAEVGARRSALDALVLTLVPLLEPNPFYSHPGGATGGAATGAAADGCRAAATSGGSEAAGVRSPPLSLEEVHADVWRERCSPLLRRVMESSHAAQRYLTQPSLRVEAAAAPASAHEAQQRFGEAQLSFGSEVGTDGAAARGGGGAATSSSGYTPAEKLVLGCGLSCSGG